MDLLSPSPYWPVADGLPSSFPAAGRDLRADVAVVGAGITGAVVAWHLAEAGIDTVVFDRREAVHGSTSGSTSLLQYELDLPLHRLAEVFGEPQAAYCYRRTKEAVDAIGALVRRLRLDCGHERKESLFAARYLSGVGDLRLEYETRRRNGFRVEWWPRQRLAQESSLPHAAAILSRDAAQVDAYRLAYGLLIASGRKGVRVFDRTPVTLMAHRGRHVELRVGGGWRARVRHVVIASGYEADAVLRRPLTQLRSTYALASEPVEEFRGWPRDRCLIWETGDPYLYLRTTQDGRAIVGGGDEPFRDAGRRDRKVASKAAWLGRRFARMFPGIAFQPAYAWAGTFAATKDGLPFLGTHPGHPGYWFALGYGGNGVAFSLIAAELIRDGILGRPNPDGVAFGFGRMGRL